MQVAFTAPDGDGNRWARRSDENGEARVSQEACKGLRTQWWQLLDKAVALGDDSRIDWLRITEQGGKSLEVIRSDGVFRIDGNSVNIEFLKKTLARCAYLVASGFTGPVSKEGQDALAAPTWKVEWRHEGAERGPLRPDGVEVYEWRIGRRINATDYECTISNLPGTVFLMAGRDFNMLRETADGIDRARTVKK
jgi:hypothetical protein